MTWLMVRAKIYQEEQLPAKYCMIRHFQFLVIHNMMDISKETFQLSTNFLTKSLKILLRTQEQELFLRIDKWLMNGKGPSLKNLQYCKFTTINNASQTILGESGRKINRIWVNQGSKFYNKSMKSRLHDYETQMYWCCINSNEIQVWCC